MIITNKKLPVDKTTVSEVRALFLKKRTSLSGVKALPINAKPNTPLRAAFANKVLGMSAQEENQYWQNQKIMKGEAAPAAFKDTGRAVFKLGNGVSYIFRSNYSEVGSKVLLVIP